MESTSVLQKLEQLDDEIDDLEEALSPVLGAALSSTLSKLPVLDKAKLFVLVTYSIESVLFSYLRLNGVKAREHPVFKELTRVKQYFEKIKNAENPAVKRENLALDKKAAGRFITAALSGNNRYDLERAEHQAKERARAHIKFEQNLKKQTAESTPASLEDDDSSSDSVSNDRLQEKSSNTKKRKADTLTSSGPESSAVSVNEAEDTTEGLSPKRKKGKDKKRNKKRKSKTKEDSN